MTMFDAAPATWAGGRSAPSAPLWPSLGSLATALLTAALLAFVLVHHNVVLAACGYALGALFTPALAILHRFKNESAKKNPYYVHKGLPGRLIVTALMLGIAGGMGHAWVLATELAKR